MPLVTVEIKGLNELRTKLRSLAPELARRITTSGLEAAAEVLGGALHESAAQHIKSGEMDAAITTGTEVSPSGTSGVAKAGFGEQSHKALWIEMGHRIMTHLPGHKEVGHVPAKPFARQASESSKEAARDAVLAAARNELEKI